MKKIIVLLVCTVFFSVLSYAQSTGLNTQNLSKKWKLDKYTYSIFSENPSEKEKNDYLHLKSDMTFDDVSEGEKDSGQWRLNIPEKRIYLSKNGEEGELVLIIDGLFENQLILIIEDPSDEDADNFKIHFKS
ncbi:MAG: hypothetical protein AB8B69_08305 [Chitinophagales bacterium]